MKYVNMHDAKTNLSRYVAGLAPGEVLVLCNRNQPVAEVRAISKPKRPIRRIGACKGEFEVTDAFFDPLPQDILDAFNGK